MRKESKAPEPVTMERKPVTIPTYQPPAPDKNPVFFEKRAYQGACGRIYPLPITDRLSHEKVDKPYDSVTLENEYIRIMVLPEIGGRIHEGLDKTNGYNFIYHNTVIKPALIGTAGPWCSGGIEFNWPQHHRPTTFLPVETALQHNADGSRTAWVGEVEPLYGLKSMAGVTVAPGRSYLKVQVRAYNPTPFPQPFMWWANLGVHCDEHYRIIFPPDIHHLAFHDRAFITSWPMVEDRMTDVPGSVFDGSWFKNHGPAGSFMVMDGSSAYDFIEGYDMARQAGTVHVANRHISPGKKLFTWGNADFAQAWRGNLTDSDGHYLELMTGVYTDNQPDFSWMQPHETRTFEHCWYPVRDIGFVKNATEDAAVSMELTGDKITLGYYATGRFEGAAVVLKAGDRVLYEQRIDIDPANPFLASIGRPAGVEDWQFCTALIADGRELVSFRPLKPAAAVAPPARTPSPEPKDIGCNEELFIHGLHIEQYRHHSLEASDYYLEALRRDPGDIRCNNAMGLLELRAGQFESAEGYFLKALERLKSRNTNPYDGEPEYNLGLARRYLGKYDEAYQHFYKATWNYAWKSPAYHALAELDARRGDLAAALRHVGLALSTNAESIASLNLKSAILRHLGRNTEAAEVATQAIALDPLDLRAQFELALAQGALCLPAGKAEYHVDLAVQLARAGFLSDGLAALQAWLDGSDGNAWPMVLYAMGNLYALQGDEAAAKSWFAQTEQSCPDYCFPNKLEHIAMLTCAQRLNPTGPKAWYYLGNLYYDKHRYDDAIACWEQSRSLDGGFAIVHRNLALAYFDKRKDSARAIEEMRLAVACNPHDSRLLFEQVQALKNSNTVSVSDRLALLAGKDELVTERNDFYVEALILLVQAGRLAEAEEKIIGHVYDIYEGGEGKLVRVYEWISILQALERMGKGDPEAALACILKTLTLPEQFHEGRSAFNPVNHVHYFAGLAAEAAGNTSEAQAQYRQATAYIARPGEANYYQGLAFCKLKQEDRAAEAFHNLLREGAALVAKGGKYDFFATGVPTPLPFEGDRERRNLSEGHYMQALALAGLGRAEEAQAELEAVFAANANHLGAWIHSGKSSPFLKLQP